MWGFFVVIWVLGGCVVFGLQDKSVFLIVNYSKTLEQGVQSHNAVTFVF